MNRAAIHSSAIPATPARGVIVRNPWARNLLTFLMVFGPGLIVMEADNDAGAVSTYIQAGAQYGTHLLWLLVLLLPITYFIQEMVVRLGIATGQGHAAMIYTRFGKWWGLFSLVDLQLLNFLTLVTEFAAIALALRTPEHLAADRRSRGGLRPHAAGAHGKLSPMGTHRGVPLPPRSCLVCARILLASRGRRNSAGTPSFPRFRPED